MENRIKFESDGFLLEGLLCEGSKNKAVVITHPHPLYGGEMHNSVVSTLKNVYAEKGYTTLRFNFRGAGYSQGEYDDGVGEQSDVLSAMSFLKKKGFEEVVLAGYSFGAWINLMVASDLMDVKNLVLVSPPVDFIEFKPMKDVSSLRLVVCGSNDQYAGFANVKKMMCEWNHKSVLEEVKGADHFYSGTLDSLKDVLLKKIL